MKYEQGHNGEGYEVSSVGDARFSALYAYMEDGRTLEMHYQCDEGGKGYDPLGRNWRAGKGKGPIDKNKTPNDLWEYYLGLWRIWANANPELIEFLKLAADHYGGKLHDRFAKTPVNQARALAVILNEKFKEDPI